MGINRLMQNELLNHIKLNTMKTRKPIIVSLSVLVFAALTFGLFYCASVVNESVRGSGTVIISERTVESFKGIDVSGALDIYLTQGDAISVKVETDDNLQEYIIAEVKNNTLKLYTKPRVTIKKMTKANVYITFVDINNIDISGACKITGENKFSFNELNLDLSGASKVKMDLDAKQMKIDASGASNLTFKGNIAQMIADFSGASDLNGEDLIVKKLKLEGSGASTIKIQVTESLSADVSGATTLKYKGNPETNSVSSSGASKISTF